MNNESTTTTVGKEANTTTSLSSATGTSHTVASTTANGITTCYLIHEHPDETSEGFGSHARGVVFPLLHICLVMNNNTSSHYNNNNDTNYHCQWQPVLWHKAYHGNTARPDYNQLNVAAFFQLPDRLPNVTTTSQPDRQQPEPIIEINTWSDPVIGSACGDARILAQLICKYLLDQSQKRENDDNHKRSPPNIRLVGSLRYMNPSPMVWEWLQELSKDWNHHPTHTNDNDTGEHYNSSTKRRVLRVAAHVRVPEHFCPQSWKDDNHVSKLLVALDWLVSSSSFKASHIMELTVYTEADFSPNDQHLLLQSYASCQVVRGSHETLLHDIRQMASADIFIPSASHLSSLVGYLTHGLVLLSHPSRWEYFSTHQSLGCHVTEIKYSN